MRAQADGNDNDCDGVIDRVSQAIDFGGIADQPPDIGIVPLNAASSSGLPVNYILELGNAGPQDNLLQFHGAGQVSVTAYQEGDDRYLPAEPFNQTFCINPPKPLLQASEEHGYVLLISSSQVNNQWFLNGILLTGEANDTLFIEKAGTYTVQVVTDQCFSELSDEFHVVYTGTGTEILHTIMVR